MPALTRRWLSLGLAAAGLARGAAAEASRFDPFAIYYGHADRPGLDRFALLVLDPDCDPALLARHRGRATCLGYLSLAELHEGRSYAAAAQAEGLLLPGGAAWPGARHVDLRDPRWQRRVVGEIVPAILAKGFHGLFLDTLDSADFLETREPRQLAGLREAAVTLVRAVRAAAPGAPIMVNRGYAVLPRLAGAFDMLLGESVRTTFGPEAGRYRRVSEADYTWQRDRLLEAKARWPGLLLFTLDYWDPQDRTRVASIEAEQRRAGFIPYVSTPDLTTVPEPA